jgi:hypothetical protein
MLKITLSLFSAFLMLAWYSPLQKEAELQKTQRNLYRADSLPNASSWPDELVLTPFTGPDLTPSPACMAVASTGEVFVGVDMIGSLGKDPGKGSIIKLVDSNNDGKVDKHTVFAMVDDPRGIIAMGDKVYVLHTIFSKESKLATGMDFTKPGNGPCYERNPYGN